MYALVVLTKLFLFMLIVPLAVLGGFMLLMFALCVYALVLCVYVALFIVRVLCALVLPSRET